MPYTPSVVPTDPAALSQFLTAELLALANNDTQQRSQLFVQTLNVAPTKPREGMIVKADGTNWNPAGYGGGAHIYKSGAWKYLVDSAVFEQSEWSLMWFSDVRAAVTAGTDCTAAVAAVLALKVAAGGGGLFFPRAPSGGAWLFNGGAASADGLKNGILLPFATVNADASKGIQLRGEQGTVFKCGSNSMVLVRVARNNCALRDITLDCNSKTTVTLCGVVPEDMTQTTTQVSQSYSTLDGVDFVGGAGCDNVVYQPGPQVGGSDSGCFYHNVIGGWSNDVGGGRAFYFKKNADWGTHPNHPTRINVISHRVTRGNVGYHFEVGSEIALIGCNEEIITSGVTPLGTPTARHITADCSNITFYGGYSEACTKSVALAANNLASYGYKPASGSTVDWRTYASAYDDGVDDSSSWTPVLVSSGGGAQGAATSTGFLTKTNKIVHFTCQVSAAKGTLGAGTLSVTGLPFVADSGWAGASLQGLTVTNWDSITFSANVFTMQARISGATIELRKLHAAGGGPAGLTLAECGATVVFEIQGWYKAV